MSLIAQIEDEALYRRHTKDCIKRLGADYVGFASEKKARAKLPHSQCDVLITDTDGFDVARELQSARPELPLIVLSSSEAQMQKRMAYGAGLRVNKYIVKNENWTDVLASCLKKLLSEHEMPQKQASDSPMLCPIITESWEGEILEILGEQLSVRYVGKAGVIEHFYRVPRASRKPSLAAGVRLKAVCNVYAIPDINPMDTEIMNTISKEFKTKNDGPRIISHSKTF